MLLYSESLLLTVAYKGLSYGVVPSYACTHVYYCFHPWLLLWLSGLLFHMLSVVQPLHPRTFPGASSPQFCRVLSLQASDSLVNIIFPVRLPYHHIKLQWFPTTSTSPPTRLPFFTFYVFIGLLFICLGFFCLQLPITL